MQNSIEQIGEFFRAIGLDRLIEYQRHNQPDRFEPWQTMPIRGSGKARDLYRVLHLGQQITRPSSSLDDEEIDGLVATRFLAQTGAFLRPDLWRITCHRGLFCVSDFNPEKGSDVYVGDDSILFTEFLLGLPNGTRGLDIGFGSGISTAALAGKCEHVTGIDVVSACSEAGAVTAALNGFLARSEFVIEGIERFSPDERFDVVVANPPGVPVPAGIAYGLAGNGGRDGLQMVRRFLDAAQSLCTPSGRIAMRYQSIIDRDGIVAHREMASIAREKSWDVCFYVDINIPIEVRTALSVKNAMPLNPHMSEQELFDAFDRHMSDIDARNYTSTLMLVELSGSGRCFVSSTVVSTDLDDMLVPGEMQSAASVAAAKTLFISFLGNAPGILWRISDKDQIFGMVDAFSDIVQLLRDERSVRKAHRAYLRQQQRPDDITARSFIIPFQLAATALLETNFLKIHFEQPGCAEILPDLAAV